MNETELRFFEGCPGHAPATPDSPPDSQECAKTPAPVGLGPVLRDALDWNQTNRARRKRLGLE